MRTWLTRWRGDDVGRRGERLAARRLKCTGYRILARNLRNCCGEIDLLAEASDRHTIVIVEVKSGTGGTIRPEVHVNRAKHAQVDRFGRPIGATL